MYRGGGEDIDIFDRKKSKASNLYGRGFYFTDSEAHAKQYGDARSYYLRIEKPLNASSGTKRISESQIRAFLQEVEANEDYGLDNYGYGATVESVLKGLKGKSDFDALQDINATAIGDFVAAIELFNEVNGTSYDGIITPTETVVFDSKQIKSATDNVGLFDPDNPNVKFSLKEAAEKYDGKDLANDKSLYDYDFMTALPDMRITEMADINAVRDGGNVSEELVINLALANGRENGHVNGDLLLVQNAYTGRNIRLTTSAIRHGLGGRNHAAQNANARAFAKAGELMKNAVPINALYNTAKAADGTYAMAAFMRDASNKSVQVAVLTVEQRNGDVVGLETYDTLHAMNTRKWNVGDHKTQSKNSSTRSSAISIDDSLRIVNETHEPRSGDVVGMDVYDTLHSLNTRKRNAVDPKVQTASTAEEQGLTSTTRSSAISIADFLEIVNETHQSLLSEDVLAHFDAERNAQGYYSGRAKFSLKETDETVQEGLTTLESLFHLTSAHRMTDKEAARMARKVKTAAQSTMDTDELAGRLKHIYDYVERGGQNTSMDAVDSELNALAEEVMATSQTLDMEHEERMAPIREYLRKTKVQLTEAQRKEAAGLTGNVGTYRRMLFGKVRISNEGTRLDTLWSELNAMDAQMFPKDAGEAEMAALLLDAADQMAPVYMNNSGLNAMEAAQWLTGEMNNAYLSLSGVQAAAKEQQKLAVDLKQYRQMTQRFAKEHKAAFDEAMAKVKADMELEKAQMQSDAERQRRLDRLEAEADAEKRAKAQVEEARQQAQQQVERQRWEALDAVGDEMQRSREEMAAYREAMMRKNKAWREAYRANAKETNRKQRYRTQISRMAGELLKKLEKPTDKKHVQAGLDEAVAEFLQGLELGGKNQTTRSLSERIGKLGEKLRKAKAETEGGSGKQYLIDADLLEDVATLTEEVRGLGSMSEMNADQMRDMRDMVKAVGHIVTMADQMFAMKKRVSTTQVAQQSMEEMRGRRDKKQRTGFLGMVDELVNNGMLDSFRFFDRLGATGREVYQNVRDGFDRKVQCVAQAEDYVQEHMKGLGKDAVKGRKAKKSTYEVSNGQRVELTKAQVMELYCLSKREQARMHLLGGGMRTESAAEPVRVTEADVARIIGTLSEQERNVADALQQFMARECAMWGNETSMVLYGYRKFGEKNYYPITVDRNTTQTLQTEAGQTENLYAIQNMGMTKSLKENASNALQIGDIFDTFSRHVDNMSTYHAFAAPVADMLRWYNYRGADGSSVKTMLERKYGAKGRDYITTLIRDLNGQNKAGYSTGMLESMTQRSKSSSVGANMRVAIQQPTAIARAAEMMSPKYIAAGLTLSGKQMSKATELAQKYCPIAKWKSMGFYETHIGRGLRDMLFGGSGLRSELTERSMWLAGKMDEVTWGALWRACEAETRDLRPELKGEAFYETVGKRLSEIIDYTQVVDTPLHRSQLMRSKNYGAQMMTAFQSEAAKTYNMLYSSIAGWAENRKDPAARAKVGRTLLVYAANTVLNAVAQSVWDAVRDDDEDEEWLEKFMQALLGDYSEAKTAGDYLKEGMSSNLIGGLNPLGLLPLVGDVLDMLQGYDPSRMDLQAVEKVIQIANQLTDGKKSDWSAYKWIRSVASAVSAATGVPVENAVRDLASIYNTASMALGGKPLSLKTETATASIAYGNLYDALLDGNQKKWNRIEAKLKADEESPKSNADIDAALGKLLAEDDERIAQAWEAKSAGKANEVNRLRMELVDELAEAGVLDKERLNEVVDKAVSVYGNKVTPKEEAPVETDKALKVQLYTTKDAAGAVRGAASGTVSVADARAMISELVADSTAKDSQKTVRSNVLKEVKPDYLKAVKSGNTSQANRLGRVMQELLGVTDEDMDGWVVESYREDLKTAVDGYDAASAKRAVTKLRASGADDYSIKRTLDGRYAELYKQAMKKGERQAAKRIKEVLMGLGLKYKSGDAMYTESTFEGWGK